MGPPTSKQEWVRWRKYNAPKEGLSWHLTEVKGDKKARTYCGRRVLVFDLIQTDPNPLVEERCRHCLRSMEHRKKWPTSVGK